GYRPAAVAVLSSGPDQPPATASVWHRPVVPEWPKDNLAIRQTRSAVALLQSGRAEDFWPLLRQRPDPRLRSYLVYGLGQLGADPNVLADRLAHEPDASVRQALVLSLGYFPGNRL